MSTPPQQVFSAKVLGFKEEKQTVSCVVDPDWTTLEVRIEFMATMYAMLEYVFFFLYFPPLSFFLFLIPSLPSPFFFSSGGVGHEKLKEHGGMFHLMSAATMYLFISFVGLFSFIFS